MENYEDLEKGSFIFVNGYGSEKEAKAIVEKDIGITIKSKDGKEFLACLGYRNRDYYEELFYIVVDMIKEGKVYIVKLIETEIQRNPHILLHGFIKASEKTCPFKL